MFTGVLLIICLGVEYRVTGLSYGSVCQKHVSLGCQIQTMLSYKPWNIQSGCV